MDLSPTAQRVLGALIEKEMATPQGYPLSLNALTTACNQTTNRDPVTTYGEAEVADAVRDLSGQGLVRAAYARRSSTPKYEHQLGAHLEIGPAEVAVLAVLLLRGPQTVGELRQRTDRLHPLADLDQAQDVLDRLAAHPFGALVDQLPRQPGQKEVRWVHLLGVTAPATSQPGMQQVVLPTGGSDDGRMGGAGPEGAGGLGAAVADLQARVGALEARLAALEGGPGPVGGSGTAEGD